MPLKPKFFEKQIQQINLLIKNIFLVKQTLLLAFKKKRKV